MYYGRLCLVIKAILALSPSPFEHFNKFSSNVFAVRLTYEVITSPKLFMLGGGRICRYAYYGIGNGLQLLIFRTLLIILADGSGKGHRVSLAGVEETAGARPAQAEGDGGTTGDD